MKPYAFGGLVGVLAAAMVATAACEYAVMPRLRRQAALSAEVRYRAKERALEDAAYFRGVVDAVQGKATAESLVVESYLLVRSPKGDIRRVPAGSVAEPASAPGAAPAGGAPASGGSASPRAGAH